MIDKEIKLSRSFSIQTTKAIASIFLFVFTYLLILLLAIGFTILCVYGGIMLITSYPNFLTLVLGIGLSGLGILILFFLLKFIFKSQKVDRSFLYEIKKNDEPELFLLISEIVNEVKTRFPKKVYLSANVNASVFYNYSFWSMIFPVRKNLQIGLGLVNAASKDELKAILSHEFGHFSQRTMRVGSYVYNVNQVIFNLIYEDENYDNIVHSLANTQSYISIFGVMAINITKGIKWLLRKLYVVVNKSYMGLSREMEFHADEIAAYISGYEPLKSFLLRAPLADHSFNSVLYFYDGKISENLISENIYKEQSFLMEYFAQKDNITIVNGFPQVTMDDLNKYNKSKLIVTDQWASHPSTADRIDRLEKTNFVSKEMSSEPANTIFRNIEETQKKLSSSIFKDIENQKEFNVLSFEDFQTEFIREFTFNTFSEVYNGYYNDKNPSSFDLESIPVYEESTAFSELFSDKQVDLVYMAIALQNDIEVLKQMADKTFAVKTFDYDGRKYKRKESKALLAKLNVEIDQIKEQIKQNDIRIFNYFTNCEKETHNEQRLKAMYEEFFEFDRNFDVKYEIYTKLVSKLQFVSTTTPIEIIKANFVSVEFWEEKLKNEIRLLLSDDFISSEITLEIKENFELYLTKKWKYFGSRIYFDDNLQMLYSAMNNYAYLLSRKYFLIKKELLNYQENLLKDCGRN
ncbi:MAG: M48 family metalloprotease [Bacteroidales bacterium]|nr:M48 family metalloprotease [Bacteroidales bacterium]